MPAYRALRRAAYASALLLAGCLSRWSGCRSYDAARLAGSNWTARVLCQPSTELSLSAPSVLSGCSARWSLVVAREGVSRQASLVGPALSSPDCGAVRSACSSARAELAQRPDALGTYVAGRAPQGGTRVAFVPAECGATYLLPDSVVLAPQAALGAQAGGAALIDNIIATHRITSEAWPLVCGSVLRGRLPALRRAALECRTPEAVARELFRTDPASVEAMWGALVAGTLPCADAAREVLFDVSAQALGVLALRSLAACALHCAPRGRVEPLLVGGALRLPAVRDSALRLASAGPPATGAHDDFDEWFASLWALTRVDPHTGTGIALASLRTLGAPSGLHSIPEPGDDVPALDRDDPALAVCSVLLGAEATAARDGLWQLASDASVSPGLRQHALLTLARFGDERATGAGLPGDPLDSAQLVLVRAGLALARGVAPAAVTGGHHGHLGHHGHHFH